MAAAPPLPHHPLKRILASEVRRQKSHGKINQLPIPRHSRWQAESAPNIDAILGGAIALVFTAQVTPMHFMVRRSR